MEMRFKERLPLTLPDLGEKCVSLSNDYQKNTLLEIHPQSNRSTFLHMLLGHILTYLEQTDQTSYQEYDQTQKCSISYYCCTDETKLPSQTVIPKCTQYARHRKYSLYYT